MSESNALFSAENLQPIVAVTFVLALLALAFNFYTYSHLSNAAAALAGFDAGVLQKIEADSTATNKRIASIEKQVAEAKAAAAKAAAAPAPAAAEEAPK